MSTALFDYCLFDRKAQGICFIMTASTFFTHRSAYPAIYPNKDGVENDILDASTFEELQTPGDVSHNNVC